MLGQSLKAMNKNDIYKAMLSEVDKLLKLFPVSTSIAERSSFDLEVVYSIKSVD